MAISERPSLLTTWRPLLGADPRAIVPVDGSSRHGPAASVTRHGCGAGYQHGGAPRRIPGSTRPPPRTSRRTHAHSRRPRIDRTARPTHRASFTERLDMRGDRRHPPTRRVRSSTRAPRRLGGTSPEPSPFRASSSTAAAHSRASADRARLRGPDPQADPAPEADLAPRPLARSTSSTPATTMTCWNDHAGMTSSDRRGR